MQRRLRNSWWWQDRFFGTPLILAVMVYLCLLLGWAGVLHAQPIDVTPDQLAQVVPDDSGQYAATLVFADGTHWGITYLLNCDWVTPGQQVIWHPFASGSVASITLPGSDQACTTDTSEINS